jgi:hypothetical protein
MAEEQENLEVRDVGADTPFLASIPLSADQEFLGNKETVQVLIRVSINDFVQDLKRKRKDTIPINTQRLARILLGKDRRFTAQYKWNEPGGIDQFLKIQINSTETDPMHIVSQAVMAMFGEVVDVIHYAGESGVLPEQWVWQGEAIIDKYTDLFTGVSVGTRTGLIEVPNGSENGQTSSSDT